MLTTKEVRELMRLFGKDVIYTNKVKGEDFRAVKCYYSGTDNDKNLVSILLKLNGNVKVIDNSDGNFVPDSITVRCKFEKGSV